MGDWLRVSRCRETRKKAKWQPQSRVIRKLRNSVLNHFYVEAYDVEYSTVSPSPTPGRAESRKMGCLAPASSVHTHVHTTAPSARVSCSRDMMRRGAASDGLIWHLSRRRSTNSIPRRPAATFERQRKRRMFTKLVIFLTSATGLMTRTTSTRCARGTISRK
jgi:hypothetical protein